MVGLALGAYGDHNSGVVCLCVGVSHLEGHNGGQMEERGRHCYYAQRRNLNSSLMIFEIFYMEFICRRPLAGVMQR